MKDWFGCGLWVTKMAALQSSRTDDGNTSAVAQNSGIVQPQAGHLPNAGQQQVDYNMQQTMVQNQHCHVHPEPVKLEQSGQMETY